MRGSHDLTRPGTITLRLMKRQPALDGLRAVAVTLVLLFHAGLTWMPAGYLGVSVFFTLSGFLITSLLLHEHAATGRISAREFYARRIRRLMPASLLCVTGIVVANFFGAFRGVRGLRADLIGSVFQVFNWVQLAGTTSYGDLFGGASSPYFFFSSVSSFTIWSRRACARSNSRVLAASSISSWSFWTYSSVT